MELELLKQKITKWCEDLGKAEVKRWGEQHVAQFGSDYTAEYNKTYIRIVDTSCHGSGQRSVFAFVDYDGNIYKPAGWKAPAKGVRATIDNPPMCSAQLYKRLAIF